MPQNLYCRNSSDGVDGGESYACEKAGGIQAFTVLSASSCCEPETVLRKIKPI